MERLSSRERILRTIAGQPVDRVPIWPPIPWHPLRPEPAPGDWKAQPNYRQLIPLVTQFCDPLVILDIPEQNPIAGLKQWDDYDGASEGIFDRRFFLIPPEYIQVCDDSIRSDGMRCIRYKIDTPQGRLTATDGIKPGVDTVWELEPLVKDVDDAEKLLSAPYHFAKPDLSAFFADRDRLGHRGVTAIFVTSPMVMVTRVTGLQRFMEWSILERPLVDRLIQTAYERVAERLQYVLDQGVGPLVRIGGCEQATPPLMSNRFFDEFIVGYEGRLWQMVRGAGQVLWVHCHGKIATVFDRFVAGGVQLLEPVEPPPQGDIELEEAKKRAAAGSSMSLMGNIEVSDLENSPAGLIEVQVRRVMGQGSRRHFILGTSAQVVSAISDRLHDNLIRFIETGIKCGSFPRSVGETTGHIPDFEMEFESGGLK